MRPNWPRIVLLLAIVPVVGALAWAGMVVWSGATKQPMPTDDQCVATVDGATTTLTLEQAENAAIITAVGVARGLPARAVTIALATAYQESGIRNLDYGDRDSVGLFQQRPSMGWGSVKQIMDPYYSAGKFYSALVKVKNWRTGDINDVAQEVQRSGHPQAYRKHVSKSEVLSASLTGVAPGSFSCKSGDPSRGNPEGLVKVVRSGLGDQATAHRTGDRVIIEASTQQRARAAANLVIANTGRHGVAKINLGAGAWVHDTRGLASWKGVGSGRIVTVEFRD